MDFDLTDYLIENYVDNAHRSTIEQFVPFFDCNSVLGEFHKKGFLRNKDVYEFLNEQKFEGNIIFGRNYHKHLLSEIDVLKGICMKSR